MAKQFQKTTYVARRGIIDVWNAFMVYGADFDEYDIPVCPTTATSYPVQLISWTEAKRIHNKALKRRDKDYHVHSFIHFYIDDIKFDGAKSSIWLFPQKAIKVICHFDGIITPDFSTFQDFPEAIKLFAVYQMRAFGFWVGSLGIPVINNVRWGTEETWKYSFRGIQKHTVVAIGSVASSLRCAHNYRIFEMGLFEMVKRLKPTTIIVYGSARYKCFEQLKLNGVDIVQFESETSMYYSKKVMQNE